MLFFSSNNHNLGSADTQAQRNVEPDQKSIELELVRKDLCQQSYMIFCHELNNELKQQHLLLREDCYKWFQNSSFLHHFSEYEFRLSPNKNAPYEVYFDDTKINELLIYVCQELAWQLSYFLKHEHRYAERYSSYHYPEHKEITALGLTDLRRRQQIDSDGSLPSTCSIASSSTESIPYETITLKCNVEDFDWQTVLDNAKNKFNETYVEPPRDQSTTTPCF